MSTQNSKSTTVSWLSTNQLCKVAGVSRGQLRLYEQEQLIEKPIRSAAGYRQYSQETVERLKAIQGLKDVGLTLREIGELLSERDVHGLSRARLQQTALQIMSKTEERIRQLEVIRSYLSGFAAGDFKILDDPECKFLTDFLTAGAKAN